ncbi:MAG: Cell division transport system ATP-binding protein [Bacteroidetes bacterium]|nr:Cell division transport system ATP-binding protein [Bacteroidota bacterium]
MINLTNVTVQYNGTTILDDVSLQVKPGDFVFLVGQTGSGKSTLLKLMYMDIEPTKGLVTVGPYSSNNIQSNEKPYLRRTLGIIFQDFKLLDDRNVYDNVAFTLHVTGVRSRDIKKRVLRALAGVGLAHQRNKMSHELSGGEQQRVVIARALVNNPSFLLADEPTGNLDPTTSHEILNLLKNIHTGGTAVVMATHNYDLVRKMNERIVQVKNGKLYDVEMK